LTFPDQASPVHVDQAFVTLADGPPAVLTTVDRSLYRARFLERQVEGYAAFLMT